MFLNHTLLLVFTDGYVNVSYDIGYGGAFYALVDIQQFKLDLRTTDIQTLVDLADRIKQAVKKDVKLIHPDSDDLAFLYGIILTDGCDTGDADHICVFADRQVKRLIHELCTLGINTLWWNLQMLETIQV